MFFSHLFHLIRVFSFFCLFARSVCNQINFNHFLHMSGQTYWLKHTNCVWLRCKMKTRAIFLNWMKITIKYKQYKTVNNFTSTKQSSFAFDAIIVMLVKYYKKIGVAQMFRYKCQYRCILCKEKWFIITKWPLPKNCTKCSAFTYPYSEVNNKFICGKKRNYQKIFLR